MIGGTEIWVYPNGKVVRIEYLVDQRKVEIFHDKSVWEDIQRISELHYAVELEHEEDVGLICDGIDTQLEVMVKGRRSYFISQYDCDRSITKSDRAGREIYDILSDWREDPRFTKTKNWHTLP
ncbi:MAG: hypothetical protein JKY60_02005 [Kordiimonadaceae bacterium]|nr:hypothetical protein [Kordiimonadaceae bacterium]